MFEKAGVGFSEVHGTLPPDMAKSMPGEGNTFTATGLSLVFHPRNPFVPTVHMNYRYLTKGQAWWFGGGADLTPYYPFAEDAVHFHRTIKNGLRSARQSGRLCRDEGRVRPLLLFAAPPGGPRPRRPLLRLLYAATSTRFSPSSATAPSSFIDAYMPIAERRKDRTNMATTIVISRRTGAAVMSSSTSCTTAARCSA